MLEIKRHRRDLLRLSGAIMGGSVLPWTARADEPPAAPKTPMPPIEAYASSPAIDEIALSPDGSRIAFVTQQGDSKVLGHYRVGEKDTSYLGIGSTKIRNLSWADNDRVIVTNSWTGNLRAFAGDRHEFSQARIIDLQTQNVRLLFDDMEWFYPIVLGPVTRIKTEDGYRVAASNYRIDLGVSMCLYNFAPTGSGRNLVYEGDETTRDWVFTPDGFLLAYANFDDDRKEWSLNYNTGTIKNSNFKAIYKVKAAGAWPSLEGIGRDGKSVVMYVPRDLAPGEGDAGATPRGDYYEISPDGILGEAIDRANDDRSRSALFHPKTWRLAGFLRHDDWITYDYFDPLMKKLAEALPVAMGEECRVSIAEFAEDPRKMVVYVESPNDAGTYYYSDFSTGALEFIARNYSLNSEWITQKQPFDYSAADGLKIHAYLTLPPFHAAKNLPLIVLPHGGPQSRDFGDFDWQAQVLASRGYAVLQLNFRGSDDYGDDFVSAGHGEWGRKMQTDLSDGVRYLAAQGTIDPKRVAILGASYGGYAALAGATLDAGVYRCAVSIAGVSDVKDMVDFVTGNAANQNDSESVLYLTRFLGDKSGWPDISPARQAARAYCPILLIHGTDDTVVPIEQSRSMEKALKAAGKPVEFVTYKGQDHWETVGSSRVEMMKVALAFLDKHNPA